jgi:hypothetical protein
VGLEVGILQPLVHRALADAPHEAPLHRGPGKRSDRPVGVGTPELRVGTTGHREDVMAFFGGKNGRAARCAGCPPARSTDPVRTALASGVPNAVPGPHFARSLASPPLWPPVVRTAPERPPRPRSGRHDISAAGPGALRATTGSLPRARATYAPSHGGAFVSPCPPHYVSHGGHRTFWTLH